MIVRGPIVAPGAVSEDGWLHTGDLGSFDRRTGLRIVGRKSDTIVTGGENVAPAEIEGVLLEHPAVADAAVHARADPEWGEAIVATVVLHERAEVGGRGPARVLRRTARALQGPEGDRVRQEPAADRVGQAAAPGARLSGRVLGAATR